MKIGEDEWRRRADPDFPEPPFVVVWLHAQSWKHAINLAEEAIRSDAHLKIEYASLDCQSLVFWGRKKEDFPPGYSFQIFETRELPK